MRHHAWMLVIFAGMLGCGSGSPTTTTAKTEDPAADDIPAEVSALFDRGEIAQSIEVLTQLVEKSPQDASLLALRATARHRIGKFDEALQDLDNAVALRSRDAKLYNNRGYMRLGMGQLTAALEDFNKATELSPQYKNAFNNRGLLFISEHRYDDAIAQFNRAIQIDDRYVDAYNNRGFAEFEAGQIEQALDDFNLAVHLDPQYVNAYNNRGLLRARAGDYENAIVDFTQAMMLDPLNPKYYEHRCEVYQRQGAIEKSVADDNKIEWLLDYQQYSAAVAAEKKPVKQLIQRAKHLILARDFDKAIADLDRAMVLDPKSAAALAVRAGIHLELKSIARAKADAESSIAIEPNEAAHSILGDVYLREKQFDRAIENFALARRVDPHVAEALYGRSKSLAKQGNEELSQQSLEQALALDPDVESRMQ